MQGVDTKKSLWHLQINIHMKTYYLSHMVSYILPPSRLSNFSFNADCYICSEAENLALLIYIYVLFLTFECMQVKEWGSLCLHS